MRPGVFAWSLELGACSLLLSGCAAAAVAVPAALDAVLGGVGIYQRWEDREAQTAQTEEIKRLREEIARLRGLGIVDRGSETGP